jgi:peptide/nickel transport system ATP-binding protein
MSRAPLIEVRGLSTAVRTAKGEVTVVQDLDLVIGQGETVAIVGESGCGKSLAALSIMGLLPRGQARVVGGSVVMDGRDLTALSKGQARKMHGRDIAMIFQDPMSALNPVMTIGRQIEEAVLAHVPLKGAALRERVLELLRLVKIPDPEARLGEYPHRLSGGMCQRVAIAIAIACNPRLLIADEPTTALDVTIQAQVLQLLQELKVATGMSILIITHDFGVVAEMADRVVVMYAGRKVEEGAARQLFFHPRHPYTRGLLALTVKPGRGAPGRLPEIRGSVPSIHAPRIGCAFASRCDYAMPVCTSRIPEATETEAGHAAACWLAEPEGEARVAAVGH